MLIQLRWPGTVFLLVVDPNPELEELRILKAHLTRELLDPQTGKCYVHRQSALLSTSRK